jgi:hypothetical protein
MVDSPCDRVQPAGGDEPSRVEPDCDKGRSLPDREQAILTAKHLRAMARFSTDPAWLERQATALLEMERIGVPAIAKD